MKRWLLTFLLLSLLVVTVSKGEVVYVAGLFTDAYADEEFILVDDTSKIDELRPIVIVSRDGSYREEHRIKHLYDRRSIYLTERLVRDFLSGARIYQTP